MRRRWWSCLQITLCVPAFLAASLCGRQLPSLGWGSPCEGLGCLNSIFTGLILLFWLWLLFQINLKWSKQYLVVVCQHLREKYKRLTNLVYEFWSGCVHVLTVGRERHKFCLELNEQPKWYKAILIIWMFFYSKGSLPKCKNKQKSEKWVVSVRSFSVRLRVILWWWLPCI